ncbi:Uncharacterised protein [Klebsiella pneumoniae]|uniref:Uncharacterized protein n=1 Tax=Klebsiella pneumoniae TaxID=573 RepID=A0A377VX65_KLEPN|nr:Uncharacterised protein [Klebsiella pneumoniae]STW38652.1 Uncharacterised protein [Klebsiella pneumoniae]
MSCFFLTNKLERIPPAGAEQDFRCGGVDYRHYFIDEQGRNLIKLIISVFFPIDRKKDVQSRFHS